MSEVRIHDSWKKELVQEFEKEYFKKLVEFAKKEYASKTIYPPPTAIFKAFDLCPFDEVKVVIIGQDPYHGAGQANGLCFAVNEGVTLPPSLKNIYKEIEDDIGEAMPDKGTLEGWAQQGVLLLNATLTVQASQAGSHQGKGWEEFTDAVIRKLSEKRENLVYLLWGKYAQNKGALIDSFTNCILTAAHPSPFSVTGFFGSRHFSKANEYLVSVGKEPIAWAKI